MPLGDRSIAPARESAARPNGIDRCRPRRSSTKARTPSTRCSTASSPRIRGTSPASTAARARSSRATVRGRARSGMVIGGGSGHEPTFLGFVGKGLADAAAVGNVFASPPPDPILECAKAVRRRRGRAVHVRQLCRRRDELRHGGRDGGDGGHRGAHRADHRRRRLRAARPARQAARRRRQFLRLQGGGRGRRHDAVARRVRAHRPQGQRPHLHDGRGARRPARCRRPAGRISRSARTRWRSAWASMASPASRAARCSRPTRSPTRCWTASSSEMQPAKGDRVAVLVNSLGSTPLMELYIMNRRVRAAARRGRRLGARDLGRPLLHLARDGRRVGDAACISTTSCRRMLDHPCDCAMFRAG